MVFVAQTTVQLRQPNSGLNTPKTKAPLEIDPPFSVPQIPPKSEDITLDVEASDQLLGKLEFAQCSPDLVRLEADPRSPIIL